MILHRARIDHADRAVEAAKSHHSRRSLLPLAMVLVIALHGCAGPENPSFPLTVRDAEAALRSMRDDRPPLARPLVIVGGYGDPGFASSELRKRIAQRIDDERILDLSFTEEKSFDECRDHLIEAVIERFGDAGAGLTTEVDVVANSMGGLIAVHAADPRAGPGRLRIARLFALSTPFRGAGMANAMPINAIVRDMQPGSAFLTRLQDSMATTDYEIIPYVRLGDVWVGTVNTAPMGEIPFWVPNRAFEPAHLTAYSDPRIQADILRRLRGEPPFTTEPRTPLPNDE
jgi:pimeloyl-ACP methyl ester carboxylesterase